MAGPDEGLPGVTVGGAVLGLELELELPGATVGPALGEPGVTVDPQTTVAESRVPDVLG